jgi:hypothetical protein
VRNLQLFKNLPDQTQMKFCVCWLQSAIRRTGQGAEESRRA